MRQFLHAAVAALLALGVGLVVPAVANRMRDAAWTMRAVGTAPEVNLSRGEVRPQCGGVDAGVPDSAPR